MRAGGYFAELMQATRGGRPLDAEAIREEGLACRRWLEAELMRPRGDWERTVVITHFAPSLRSADPRYGERSGTASFCNADDDLLARADLWIHGHLHCRTTIACPVRRRLDARRLQRPRPRVARRSRRARAAAGPGGVSARRRAARAARG
jgi:hypothetical protein